MGYDNRNNAAIEILFARTHIVGFLCSDHSVHHDSVYINRTHTLLVYLTTVPDGGETVFPQVCVENDVSTRKRASKDITFGLGDVCTRSTAAAATECDVFKVHPVQGTAVWWYNLDHSGKIDDFMQHGSCPVNGVSSEKWIIQFWTDAMPRNFW
eukprot:m.801409 g.801409  ORF g.801409 m.801409 type:complete len:154 (-) comp23358_c0_seq28:990-1451(-)